MVSCLPTTIAWYQLHPEMRFTVHLQDTRKVGGILSGRQTYCSYFTHEKPEAQAFLSTRLSRYKKEELGCVVTAASIRH